MSRSVLVNLTESEYQRAKALAGAQPLADRARGFLVSPTVPTRDDTIALIKAIDRLATVENRDEAIAAIEERLILALGAMPGC